MNLGVRERAWVAAGAAIALLALGGGSPGDRGPALRDVWLGGGAGPARRAIVAAGDGSAGTQSGGREIPVFLIGAPDRRILEELGVHSGPRIVRMTSALRSQ